MPRIRDTIRDCAVYVYPTVPAAEAGVTAGGSGFLVGIRSKTDENWYHPYVVTNRHVVEEGATVVRLNTKTGATDIIEVAPDEWVFHPEGDDLAVAAVSLHSDYHDYMLVNDYPMFLTRETMEEARIGLGDDVFVVGRLIDREGKQHDSPIARFGQIAMMPQELLRMADGHMQSFFLTDVQSVGRFTGSPVFVTVHHLRLQNPLEFNHAWFPHLLGVHGGYLTAPTRFLDSDKPRNGSEASLTTPSSAPVAPLSQSELMIVLPAWRVADILNLPEFRQRRSVEDGKRSGAGTVRNRTLQKAR